MRQCYTKEGKAETPQAELGKERANALVRRALGEVYRRYGEEFWRTKNKNLGKAIASAFAQYAREDALDDKLREQSRGRHSGMVR
jgi:hypothetical protein